MDGGVVGGMRIIDGHIHLGNNRNTKYYALEDLRRDLREAGAVGAVIFAFPEDIYRIIDSRESRIRANQYILEAAASTDNLYPFYFVWNDYLLPEDLESYAGIKWHRHPDEPRYDYDDPHIQPLLREIRDLGLPVLLEEEYENTLRFIEMNPGVKVIIPHMGRLNGGYRRAKSFYRNPDVYFDTSTASLKAIREALDAVGPERIIFGSDVSGTRQPFYNFPKVELRKLLQMDLDKEALRLILAENIERIIRR